MSKTVRVCIVLNSTSSSLIRRKFPMKYVELSFRWVNNFTKRLPFTTIKVLQIFFLTHRTWVSYCHLNTQTLSQISRESLAVYKLCTNWHDLSEDSSKAIYCLLDLQIRTKNHQIHYTKTQEHEHHTFYVTTKPENIMTFHCFSVHLENFFNNFELNSFEILKL